jgi:ABC-type uncharacterized transport system ATPase subunit
MVNRCPEDKPEVSVVALVASADILFLDETPIGLDPLPRVSYGI